MWVNSGSSTNIRALQLLNREPQLSSHHDAFRFQKPSLSGQPEKNRKQKNHNHFYWRELLVGCWWRTKESNLMLNMFSMAYLQSGLVIFDQCSPSSPVLAVPSPLLWKCKLYCVVLIQVATPELKGVLVKIFRSATERLSIRMQQNCILIITGERERERMLVIIMVYWDILYCGGGGGGGSSVPT